MPLHPNPLSVKYLTGVIESRPDAAAWRAQYIGTKLLPTREVEGYELTWDVVSSENGLAGIYAINGRPVPGSDKLFAQKYAEVINIMASRVLHPSDVAILREPGELAVTRTGRGLRQKAQRKLRDLIAWCDDTVDATVEYLILRSLQGAIVWPPRDADGNPISQLQPEWGNVSITINYPLRSGFKQNASTLTGFNGRTGGGAAWTNLNNSNPLLDLEVIAHYMIEETGLDARNATLIMGGDVLSYLCVNESILEWLQQEGSRFVAPQKVLDFIKTQLGYDIIEYNARWTYRTDVNSPEGPTINSVPFLNRGHVLIIPKQSKPGYLALAPSPDGQYKPGKYTWIVEDNEPPWEVRIGEGLVCLPIPEYYSDIFVLNAFA